MTARELYLHRNGLWLEALRSGEFKQTQNVLKDDTGHCCLGVACEVYRRHAKRGKWKLTSNHIGSHYRFMDQGGNPPEKVARWFGWPSQNPRLKGVALSDCNDDLKWSFKKTATAVEKAIKVGAFLRMDLEGKQVKHGAE